VHDVRRTWGRRKQKKVDVFAPKIHKTRSHAKKGLELGVFSSTWLFRPSRCQLIQIESHARDRSSTDCFVVVVVVVVVLVFYP
jgi:hypothetical protein